MLFIVGNVFKDFRAYLSDHGIEYGVFVNMHAKPNKALDNIHTVPLDFSSKESLITSASKQDVEVTGILVAGYENYVLPASILAEHYKVPATSVASALAATDKARMRACFTDYNPAISPAFSTIHSWQDIETFMLSHDYPVMLKPTNLMKSLFISKNTSPEELRIHYEEIATSLASIGNRIYTMDPPGVIIEQCMEGSMHTVAGFVDHTGEVTLFDQIVDCITAQDIGVNDNYLYSRNLPTQLTDTDVASILDVARQGALALGLTSTMLHIEIMLTPEGPKIIEIGARIGGYRSRMYAYSSGLDMQQMLIDLAMGRVPQLTRSTPRSIAAIELFPAHEGKFKEISGHDQLAALPSLQYISVKAHPEKVLGPSKHGYKAAAVLILANDDTEQFENDMQFIRNNVSIQTST